MGDKGANRARAREIFGGVANATPPRSPDESDAFRPGFDELVRLRMTVLDLLQQNEQLQGRGRLVLTGNPRTDGELVLELLDGKPLHNFHSGTGKLEVIRDTANKFSRPQLVEIYMREGIADYLKFEYGD